MPSIQKQRESEIALHFAIRNLRVDEVGRLLASGVDPNAFDQKSRNFKYAFTALCTAIATAAHTISHERAMIAEANRELFPESDAADLPGERRRSLEILRLLLSAGADPNLRTYSRTPLSLAADVGDVEVVTLLLDAGAHPDGGSWSPFSKLPRPKGELAFYGNALHEATEKEFREIVRLLCSRGADKSARNHQGDTALQIARKLGRKDLIDILKER